MTTTSAETPNTSSETLLEVLRNGNATQFKALLRSAPETVVDAAFEEANREERLAFLRLMPIERAASGFTDLSLELQANYLPDLPSDRLRLMGAFVGPDEIADLLGELGSNNKDREHLLMSLPQPLVQSALELERYEDDDAGGLMTPEFVAVREGWTVAHTLGFLRQAADHAETVSNLYLVNGNGQLSGVIPLQALVTASPLTRVDDIAQHETISARTDTDQEDVARLMRDYDLSVMPVVDETGVLKGIVTIDDVVDVIEEEATEDIYKGAAMEGSEIDYLRSSPLELWRKRVFWLMALSLSEFLTVSVNRTYEAELGSKVIGHLGAFVPALIGMGGNTGSQSAILIVRAISQGQVRGRDTLRVLAKEFSSGLLLGAALGAFAFVRIGVLYREPTIASIVAIALFFVVIAANIIGGLLPIGFKKLGVDPAVTSSPFLATIMDATGLVIYFSVAKIILGL